MKQSAASPDLQFIAGLVLQRSHGLDDIACEELSCVWVLAPPRRIGLVKRAGHDILGQRIDRFGNGIGRVGLIRPVAAEYVERSATEQKRAGVTVELGDKLADSRVGKRGLPPP